MSRCSKDGPDITRDVFFKRQNAKLHIKVVLAGAELPMFQDRNQIWMIAVCAKLINDPELILDFLGLLAS